MYENYEMSQTDLDICINAANPWFILFYTKIFIDNWEEINSSDGKEEIIDRIYNVMKQVKLKTLKKKTVRTSVNALINIIKGGRTFNALDYVMGSNKFMRDYPEVWEEALQFVTDIADGKYDYFPIPLYKED